jgi:tRNA(Arg) A34 adenosine deaminase TadA
VNGPCAKRRVFFEIEGDGIIFRGENSCENPQAVCPRSLGEDYTKCQTICRQQGHAEIQALRAAGEHARGALGCLIGHYYVCEPCARALKEAGLSAFMVQFEAAGD